MEARPRRSVGVGWRAGGKEQHGGPWARLTGWAARRQAPSGPRVSPRHTLKPDPGVPKGALLHT